VAGSFIGGGNRSTRRKLLILYCYSNEYIEPLTQGKTKKYHTVEIVQKSKRNIIERQNRYTNIHIHDHSLTWLDTGTKKVAGLS
jgi:superfamily II helicase